MSEITSEIFENYKSLISTIPETELKGKSMLYTSINGHMYSFIDKAGTLSLRLPEDQLMDFIQKFKTKLSEQHGRVMKEYVVVPKKFQLNIDQLKSYFEISFQYTKSLKPKSLKRKSKIN